MRMNSVRGKGPCSNLFFERCKSLYSFTELFEAEEMAPGVRDQWGQIGSGFSNFGT